MCVLAEMSQPVRLALVVLVYHVVKTLVVVKICPAREQIPDAVWHSAKKLVSADVGYLSDHGYDLGLGHVCVVLCCVVMTLERRVALFLLWKGKSLDFPSSEEERDQNRTFVVLHAGAPGYSLPSTLHTCGVRGH